MTLPAAKSDSQVRRSDFQAVSSHCWVLSQSPLFAAAAGIMKMADAGGTSTGGVMWDASVSSPWYNYRASTGEVHQRWFDNATSLSLKYQVAVEKQLRAIASVLHYTNTCGHYECRYW